MLAAGGADGAGVWTVATATSPPSLAGVWVRTGTATGFVVVLCSPWVLLPWLGVRGLDRQRRWGWTLAVAGACIFLPTPALPVAVLALLVLFSARVRRVFFAEDVASGGA